jgi:hypothetical protein
LNQFIHNHLSFFLTYLDHLILEYLIYLNHISYYLSDAPNTKGLIIFQNLILIPQPFPFSINIEQVHHFSIPLYTMFHTFHHRHNFKFHNLHHFIDR